MSYPTLFKKDKKGVIREWKVSVIGNEITVQHGVMDGEIQSKVTYAKGKNKGRANETTDAEQAQMEAQSKWNEQVQRNGYREWDNLDAPSLYLEPMLALDATKVIHRVDFSRAVAQRKLDGVRCIWRPDLQKLQSRKGTFYEAPQHIIKQLEGIDKPLDGELYSHGISLNKILGASRKENELTAKLELHLFDIADTNTLFRERFSTLRNMFSKEFKDNSDIKLVDIEGVGKDTLLPLHNEWVQEGYEGLMIRHTDSPYVAGRSEDLFKYKVFKEGEYKIVEVREDKDGGAVLTMVNEHGTFFGSRPRGSLEYRRSLLDGKCIGLMATVRYFQLTDANGVPQFPIVVAIGDEK
jgi:DNA ligase-1